MEALDERRYVKGVFHHLGSMQGFRDLEALDRVTCFPLFYSPLIGKVLA
jgi:hypothetical protein